MLIDDLDRSRTTRSTSPNASSPRCRNRSCSTRSRSRRPRASASRSARRARAPTRCSATPTSRCTPPRPAARTACRVFAHEMHLAAVERLDLEAHLRGAAERGELVVHYQPIYELQYGPHHRVRGARALAAPRAWPARPAVVHPVRRGSRAHRRDRPARAASPRARRRVVESRASARDAAPAISVNVSPRQLLDARPPRPGRGAARPLRPRARPPDPRDHRRRADEGPGRGDGRAPAPERARRAARRRRLRDRLLVARLPPAVPDRPAEDRPLVRERHPHPVGLARSSAAIVQISHTLGLMPIAEGVESAGPGRRADRAAAATSPRASTSAGPLDAAATRDAHRRAAAAPGPSGPVKRSSRRVDSRMVGTRALAAELSHALLDARSSTRRCSRCRSSFRCSGSRAAST